MNIMEVPSVEIRQTSYELLVDKAAKYDVLEWSHKNNKYGIDRDVAKAVFACECGCDMPTEEVKPNAE